MAYTVSASAKLGVSVLFDKIIRVDIDSTLGDVFSSVNVREDVEIASVKVGEEKGGPWADISATETIQCLKDMQWRCIKYFCAEKEAEEVVIDARPAKPSHQAQEKANHRQHICSMPQVFMVVRCYACSVFQVQQVKKIPKWVCKMCGEKQSLKKEYGRGSGADCRKRVQKLNLLKASMENELPAIRSHAPDDWDHEGLQRRDDGNYEAQKCEDQQNESSKQIASSASSVWSQFMTDPEEHPTPDAVEPQSSHEFEDNRLTTDRDVLKGNRKRGWKRGSSAGSKWSVAGRNRKSFKNDIDEEELCHQSSVSSQSYGCNEYPPATRSWRNKNQTNHSAKRSFTTAAKKSGGSSTSALPSSNGRWGQFLKEPTHCGDNVEDDGLTEEDIPKSPLPQPSTSLTSASNNLFSARGSTTPPKSSGRWGQFLTRSHHQGDSDNHVGLVKEENTTNSISSKPFAPSSTKSTASKPSASSTTSTSSKWGQFLDNDTDEDAEENSEEFWSQDHDQSALLNQEQGPYIQQNLDVISTFDDNELMPNDDSQSSSVDGFQAQETLFTRSSKPTPGRTTDSIGDQNVDSLQGSNKWNVFLSNKSNAESHLDNSRKKTENDFAVGRSMSQVSQNDSENKLVVTSKNGCQNNRSHNQAKVQSALNGHMFSIEEHDLDEFFSDDW